MLVVSDIMMPNVSGVEMIAAMRAASRSSNPYRSSCSRRKRTKS